nr:hypothetical protein Iba_chr01aCG13650 [Ipomoea batatas]
MAELKQNSCVADEQHNESVPRNSCVASSFPRDGVLGQLSWEDKSHGGLNLTGSDGRLLVVPSQTRGLLGELLEDVVDEAVHDAHGLAGDTDVGMNLLQHLEDVDLLLAGLRLLLRWSLLGCGSLLRRGLLLSRLLLRLRGHWFLGKREERD